MHFSYSAKQQLASDLSKDITKRYCLQIKKKKDSGGGNGAAHSLQNKSEQVVVSRSAANLLNMLHKDRLSLGETQLNWSHYL